MAVLTNYEDVYSMNFITKRNPLTREGVYSPSAMLAGASTVKQKTIRYCEWFFAKWWKLMNDVRTSFKENENMTYILGIQECMKTFDTRTV